MKKSLFICLSIMCTQVLQSAAQESLLNFAHSRVVTENYNNEMSLIDEVIYYNGSDFVSEQIDCRCERQGARKIAIEFEQIAEQAHLIQLKLDLLIVMEALLVSDDFAIDRKTYSLSKMNVQLSSFNFDRLDQLRGVARLAMPAGKGFIGNEQYVYVRFKCTEGKVTNLTEGFPIANASH